MLYRALLFREIYSLCLSLYLDPFYNFRTLSNYNVLDAIMFNYIIAITIIKSIIRILRLKDTV